MFVKIYLVCFKLQIQLMYKLLFWSQDAEMHMYISLHASSPFTDISKPSVWSPGFPTNRWYHRQLGLHQFCTLEFAWDCVRIQSQFLALLHCTTCLIVNHPSPLWRCPKFTFSKFAPDPNLHKSQIYMGPKFTQARIYTEPIFTQHRFTQIHFLT